MFRKFPRPSGQRRKRQGARGACVAHIARHRYPAPRSRVDPLRVLYILGSDFLPAAARASWAGLARARGWVTSLSDFATPRVPPFQMFARSLDALALAAIQFKLVKNFALRGGRTLTPRAPPTPYTLNFYTSTQNISLVKFSPPPHCIGFGCGGYRTALRGGLCFARPCSALFTKGIFCEIECAGGLVAPFVAHSFGSVCATRRGLPALARSLLGRVPPSNTTPPAARRRASFCPRSVYEQKINAPTLSTLILYKK